MPNEGTVPAPQGESIADNSNPNITTNQPGDGSQPAQAPQEVQPDMHGFTSEQLEEIDRFFRNNGGFDAIKSKISNPQVQPQQPQQPQQNQPSQQPQQPQQVQQVQQSQQLQQLPKGYASLQELSVERYFRDLAADPKYANISEEISNGNVLKEMSAMGMVPIDENYNINVQQVSQFLALKSASVPTKPTSSEPTNTPTVEYIHAGQKISDRNSAFEILHQSFELKQKGLPPHPLESEAQEFLQKR